MFVLAAGIYIHIAQQFGAQLIFRQHTLYYFSQQLVITVRFCLQTSRSDFSLTAGIACV